MINRQRGKILAIVVPLLLGAGCAAPETALTVADAQRGALLYENVCGACHTAQLHWREKHLVHSWSDLVYQVEGS